MYFKDTPLHSKSDIMSILVNIMPEMIRFVIPQENHFSVQLKFSKM